MTTLFFELPSSAPITLVNDFENVSQTFDGMEVEFQRRLDKPDFLPYRVKKNGRVMWLWQAIKQDFPQGAMAFLVMVNDQPVIAGIKPYQELLFVTPLADLEHSHLVRGSDGNLRRIGGQNLSDVVLLKEEVASFFEVRPNFSAIETRVYNSILATRRFAQEQERATRQAERQAQLAQEAERNQAAIRARQERRAAILARRQIRGFTEEGTLRRGYPVVDKEWEVLEDGTFCIQVESYDVETGACGPMIEAFQVNKKSGGRVSKRGAKLVFPEKVTAASLQAVKEILVQQGEVFHEVPVYEHYEALKTLQEKGVNGSTLVGVQPAPDQPLEVYAISNKQGIKPAQGVVIHQ